ncbi:NB-ARC domain-containing protein [Streptomyces sp. NPDC000151]|uniref:ATP-binding protein n=1 Tax=Streptomyces sp. NPDC000151 TaxID=3154244 RepID=UPI00332F3891
MTDVSGPGRLTGNLPAESTSLVGREGELAVLDAMVAESRLVTLVGVGGVGKSRLALRAAARSVRGFDHGAWLVPLAPLRAPELLGITLLEGLGLADASTRPSADVVAEWLADKRLLLVLDSCEHLVEACADLVRTLLAAAAELHVVVTSRQPLGVTGERQLEVSPLSVEDAEHRDGDAVTLFAERTATVLPGFTVSTANRDAVRAVCRRLDGIPLAIELAAVQAAELSVEQLRDRLRARFEVLTARTAGGGDGVLPRHLTLRTTIGWSHELCSPPERLLWTRLSVFPGGFDRAAATAVCSGGPLTAATVPGVLAGLAAKSLVRRLPTDAPARPRYDLLDTVREYGAEWLHRLGEEDEWRRRHWEYYRGLARQAAAGWVGPEQVRWCMRMVTEHANLRAALEYGLSDLDGRSALDLAGTLWFFWHACGFAREGRHYLDRALDRWPVPGRVRSSGVFARGVVAIAQGDAEVCAATGRELEVAAERDGSPGIRNAAAYLEGTALVLRGRLREGIAVYGTTLRRRDDSGPYAGVGLLIRVSRAFVLVHAGESAEAMAEVDAVCATCESRGERHSLGWAYYAKAWNALALGRPREAADCARTALAVKSQLNDSLGWAMCTDVLASALAADVGREAQAARLIGIAERLWHTLGRQQIGLAELIAARESCERRIRERIGDAAYEAAFRDGLETETEEGLAYALNTRLR